MFPDQLLAEATRQVTVCNACRYCEGLCAVFPALEARPSFSEGDLAYVANLCHDCGACVDACPFTAPHEFAIDIRHLLADARLPAYATYARPRWAWRTLTDTKRLFAAVVAVVLLVVAVAAVHGNVARLVHAHHGAGAFYQIFGFVWILGASATVTTLALVTCALGAYRFAADALGGIGAVRDPRAHAKAIRDVLTLRVLRPDHGGGCANPDDPTVGVRRYLHHAVLYGVLGMFVSTVSAAFEQDVLGIQPPYPVLSVPVLLGSIGGISTVGGCVGFLVLRRRAGARDPAAGAAGFRRIFTCLLLAATLSGFLTLAARATPLLGVALAVHLGILGALYLALPYTKFVHAIYRYLALVRYHADTRHQFSAGHAIHDSRVSTDTRTGLATASASSDGDPA